MFGFGQRWLSSMLALVLTGGLVWGLPLVAQAFCGFYVGKADADLFNEASKVILARHDGKTVITMANDYKGELTEFAMVVPVPTVVTKQQVHVTDNAIVNHLDAYTAPRLVEYFDSNPCERIMYESMMRKTAAPMAADMAGGGAASSAKAMGVTIEDQYTVGEYDILVLSAKHSNGLQQWLDTNGYKVPVKARNVLSSYIKQGVKFFVAKINLSEQEKTGRTYLRPLQVAFESEKFMLPIRLGTVNANGPQDLILYTLTKEGRVETSNYRTVKLPTGMDIPLFVEDDFGDFYKDMFKHQVKKENMSTVFTEYAWDMGWCDPCAADPLSFNELRELGVYWLQDHQQPQPQPWIRRGRTSQKMAPQRIMPPRRPQRVQNVFVTRLHVRYDADHFPEDLMLHETQDRTNFQSRYVLRHPWTGDDSCEAGRNYRAQLPKRFDKEAQTLANLTGWDIGDIRHKMANNGQAQVTEAPAPKPWYQWMWQNNK